MISDQEQNEFLRHLLQSDQEVLKEDFFSKTLEQKKFILKYILKNHNCEITFKKVDGSIRVMPCTLKVESLPSISDPEYALKESKSPRQENLEVIRVYCLDKQEWRSFKINNLLAIKIINP